MEPRLRAELFAIRARVLLGKAEAEDAPSYASGLLIGADVANRHRRTGESPIYVIGTAGTDRALCGGAARRRDAKPIEVDGETAFLAGIGRIAECMRMNVS